MAPILELDMYQATAVAALVLLLGRFLVKKIPILDRYCVSQRRLWAALFMRLSTVL